MFPKKLVTIFNKAFPFLICVYAQGTTSPMTVRGSNSNASLSEELFISQLIQFGNSPSQHSTTQSSSNVDIYLALILVKLSKNRPKEGTTFIEKTYSPPHSPAEKRFLLVQIGLIYHCNKNPWLAFLGALNSETTQSQDEEHVLDAEEIIEPFSEEDEFGSVNINLSYSSSIDQEDCLVSWSRAPVKERKGALSTKVSNFLNYNKKQTRQLIFGGKLEDSDFDEENKEGVITFEFSHRVQINEDKIENIFLEAKIDFNKILVYQNEQTCSLVRELKRTKDSNPPFEWVGLAKQGRNSLLFSSMKQEDYEELLSYMISERRKKRK